VTLENPRGVADATVLNEGIRCSPCPDCVVCGGAGRLIHGNLRDVLFGAPGEWGTRRCMQADCGLAWVEPMPHAAEIGRFYERYYTHAAVDSPPDAPPPPPAARRLVKRALRRVFPRRRLQFEPGLMHFADMRPGRMLEVGCGPGRFLAQASSAGWQVLGIDFDETAVAQACRLQGVEARTMDIFDPALDGERFDGIAMDNVIEHLADPARVFARCRELLAPGGRLVMVTPNSDAQLHDRYGADWRGLEVPRHLYLYNGRVLRRLADAAGLVDVQVFSLFNGSQIDFMADMSDDVARKSGHPPTVVDRGRLKRRNAIMALLGKPIGEWVTLAAHRPAG
jgi:SAM-dependent methyltransferase